MGLCVNLFVSLSDVNFGCEVEPKVKRPSFERPIVLDRSFSAPL